MRSKADSAFDRVANLLNIKKKRFLNKLNDVLVRLSGLAITIGNKDLENSKQKACMERQEWFFCTIAARSFEKGAQIIVIETS